MDAVIVGEKLESLRKCVRRLQEKRAATAADLQADLDRQDIIALNLTRAVQVCVDIAFHVLAATDEPVPNTMGEAFEALMHAGIIDHALCQRMKGSVGFRNVAVHSYQQIEWDIVHAITWQHLDDFQQFARTINQRMS